MTAPSVSVLITVYNGLPYVESAVRSVMAQTLKDIEIIIVDDASTDDTPALLAQLAAEDPRIRVETLPENQRQARASNRGLELARAPLVARMDADDLCHPERLERQKTYMDAHPQTVLVASSFRQIDAKGAFLRDSLRGRDAFQSRWLTQFHMAFQHPSILFRRVSAEGDLWQYDPAYTYADDYAFCARQVLAGDTATLPEILLQYRVHGSSLTGRNWAGQVSEAAGIARHVQQGILPADVLKRLSGFNTAFLECKPAPAAEIFEGLRAVIDHHARSAPQYRPWMRRQGAQLAMRALQRSGQGGKAQMLRAFAQHGRGFLIPLALRALEIKGWMPGAGAQAQS